jgi:hypothetical protein
VVVALGAEIAFALGVVGGFLVWLSLIGGVFDWRWCSVVKLENVSSVDGIEVVAQCGVNFKFLC